MFIIIIIIIIIIIVNLCKLFTSVLTGGSSVNSKSPKVSRTLLSILADLNRTMVWKVLNLSLIDLSSLLLYSLLVFHIDISWRFFTGFCETASSSGFQDSS